MIQILHIQMPSPERLSVIGDVAMLFLLDTGLLQRLYFTFAQRLSSHNITIFLFNNNLSGQLNLRSRPIIKHFIYLLKWFSIVNREKSLVEWRQITLYSFAYDHVGFFHTWLGSRIRWTFFYLNLILTFNIIGIVFLQLLILTFHFKI